MSPSHPRAQIPTRHPEVRATAGREPRRMDGRAVVAVTLRGSRHSASKTRVNALMARAPQGDGMSSNAMERLAYTLRLRLALRDERRRVLRGERRVASFAALRAVVRALRRRAGAP